MPTLKLIPNGAKGRVGSRSCAEEFAKLRGGDQEVELR